MKIRVVSSSFAEFQGLLDWNVSHSDRSRAEKLDYLTHFFLHRPYLSGALGEGERDTNPFIRTDCFDCLTYVNTVLALLHSTNWDELKAHMARLNYKDAQVQFACRHHFMSCDWNPENSALGYIKDVTSKICDAQGNTLTKIARAYIDKPAWFKKTAADKLGNFPIPVAVDAAISYLPLKALFSGKQINFFVLNQLPEVGLVEIVRPNWDLRAEIGTCLNVSHIGFLLKKNGNYRFRHASQTRAQIVDDSLTDYLQTFLGSSTIKGINVQAVL